MRRPIAHCLYWPRRAPFAAAELDLAAIGQLGFERPDLKRFPSLRLAMDALRHGSGAPTVLNAANEVAVQAFLARRISFTAIVELVEKSLTAAQDGGLLAEPSSIDEALALDSVTRGIARAELEQRFAAA
jgi:1-deoxy-D-xylulose-5-phosphate reductoisomerase